MSGRLWTFNQYIICCGINCMEITMAAWNNYGLLGLLRILNTPALLWLCKEPIGPGLADLWFSQQHSSSPWGSCWREPTLMSNKATVASKIAASILAVWQSWLCDFLHSLEFPPVKLSTSSLPAHMIKAGQAILVQKQNRRVIPVYLEQRI